MRELVVLALLLALPPFATGGGAPLVSPYPAVASLVAAAPEAAAPTTLAAVEPEVVVTPRPLAGRAARRVGIPAGSYEPLYGRAGDRVQVGAFELDERPVTRGDFLAFVSENAAWLRDMVKPVFADPSYLSDWPGALDPGSAVDLDRPVTYVSWFAAREYCEWRGGRLPTTDEWEYAASLASSEAFDDPDTARRALLALQTRARGSAPEPVGSGLRGPGSVVDLHGGVWQWVADFQSAIAPDDSRATGGRDRQLYCASAASGVTRTDDYAAFLRHALRTSLHGGATIGTLGFRCARDGDS